MRYLRFAISVFLLALFSAPAFGTVNHKTGWYWKWNTPAWVAPQYQYEQLTLNNGAHAVSMVKYGSPQTAWVGIVTGDASGYESRAFIHEYEYNGATDALVYKDTGVIRDDDNYSNVCVSAAAYGFEGRKVATFCGTADEFEAPTHACAEDLWVTGEAWTYHAQLSENDVDNDDEKSAVVMEDYEYGCAVFPASYVDDGDDFAGMMGSQTTNGGEDWSSADWVIGPVEDGPILYNPSICSGTNGHPHMAYHQVADLDTIRYCRGSNHGSSWGTPVLLDTFAGAGEPCVAYLHNSSNNSDIVFVCWTRTWSDQSRICYTWSEDDGATWPNGRWEMPLQYSDASGPIKYSHPNISMQMTDDYGDLPLVVMVCEVERPGTPTQRSSITAAMARLYHPVESDPLWAWALYPWLLSPSALAGYCPSVATLDPWYVYTVPKGIAVWSRPDGPYNRSLVYSTGTWAFYDSRYPTYAANSGRDVTIDAAGDVQFASVMGRYVIGGPVVEAALTPVMQDAGSQPALAVDGDNEPWIAYVQGDSLFCKIAGEVIKPVFCGSSSAFPGQPSIVCYPGQAGGVHVANVVFAVYDTAGGASKIMYARVDTGGVVLDTIESVANLGDSLPCINVYKTDSLLVTWQHGDSTLGSMLCDYGPGTAGQVPAWTSPSLVSANSYHAMSAFDEGGSVLNVIWTRNNGSNYAIQRATCDLASAAFGNWSQSATPGDTGTAEKANPVYAGLGVSCWQEKAVTGEWIIKGYVRGEEETFVANDTDAYHPHAVAESSAISPSIDQVRVHLLYTAGVTFEVDSGVYDTGDVRFVTCSLNVSHAGSDATKYNNGAKFLRKADSDSLFAVYADLDGAVMYAYSATGDTWQRELLATGRESPGIAEDSSGMRWVVVTLPFLGMGNSVQELHYRSGSSWVGPETLYTNAMATLGPASLAGASDTSTGIAYAAFLTTSGMSKSLILAKFNGSTVSTYTVATGASLGDPSLTVEPYLADSDRVHVSWEDDGLIKYCMDTDGRSSGIASNWTQTIVLSDAQVTSQHPCISADRDQIVAAWTQVDSTDIYCRKRSTDSAYNNWESELNLSNTSTASDWPTIAMGDTVVVAWQELRLGGSDFDVLACIDFGDTLNIADNATYSTYPHILFQNKASGDTAIPYLHTVWSESPSANYYEVAYNKLNLKQATGEGQQSAGTPPIPVKPSLSACRPNPFRDRTQISYALPAAGNISLRVYDVTGRTVRTLQSGFQKAGSYSVTWDSKDSRGRQVARGVYFYRLDTPGFRSVKKAVVTR